MFGMIKMEMRRKSCLPEVTLIMRTNDAFGDKILIRFFVSRIANKVEAQQCILKPIENEPNEIDMKAAKTTLVCTVLFPSEEKLQSFQREMQKGGRF